MRRKAEIVGIITGLWIVLITALAFAQLTPFQPFQLPLTGEEQLVDPWRKFQISLPAGAIAQNEAFNYALPGGVGQAGIWISITAIPDPTSFQMYSQQLSGMLRQSGWQIGNQTTRQVGQFQVQEFTAQIDNPQMEARCR